MVLNQESDKWDWVLDETLLAESAGARKLDVPGAYSLLSELLPRLATDSAPIEDFQTSSNELCEIEYSVFDLETTGLSPETGDRVIEIAVVRISGDGAVLSEWTTLVNPGRDVGPTHIHGVENEDVVEAPTFDEIAGDFLDAIEGSVLVAHNLQFDRGVLDIEFAIAGYALPDIPSLCTMILSQVIQPGTASRRLGDASDRAGVEVGQWHHALDDARATAQLLASQIRMANEGGIRTLAELGCDMAMYPLLPDIPVNGRPRPRRDVT